MRLRGRLCEDSHVGLSLQTVTRRQCCAARARERAEQRRLKRELQKEKRGAMRELRKDAAFIGAVREADAAAARAELRGARRANFGFLERQEADARSGGQGGMFKGRKRGRR